MERHIDTPTAGEILWEEFMEPMGISAYKLAQEIHVPASRIQDIQNDIDIRNLKIGLSAELDTIPTFVPHYAD